MQLSSYGDRGYLLSDLSDAQRLSLNAALSIQLPEHCSEYVLGYDSILFVADAEMDTLFLQQWIDSASADTELQALEAKLIEVPTSYNGADLKEVAALCRLSVDEVIDLHRTPIYTVHMMGFTPGFPYLEGLDRRLHLERRTSPRTRIEPGSVAIGGSHAGIYSIASPGGWHLLGHTNLQLFNLEVSGQDAPKPSEVFTMCVGDRVQFKPIAIQ